MIPEQAVLLAEKSAEVSAFKAVLPSLNNISIQSFHKQVGRETRS